MKLVFSEMSDESENICNGHLKMSIYKWMDENRARPVDIKNLRRIIVTYPWGITYFHRYTHNKKTSEIIKLNIGKLTYICTWKTKHVFFFFTFSVGGQCWKINSSPIGLLL